jgi:hypothetical protein
MAGAISHATFFIEVNASFDRNTNTIVNCVDISTNELVHSWLIVIDPMQ